MTKRLDLTNKVFGRLEVLTYAETRKARARWLCRCICGEVKIIDGGSLRDGRIKSCGCARLEVLRAGLKPRHGKYRTPTWNSWQAMLRRCYTPTNSDFHIYGGHGVVVCDRWNPAKGGSFENFLADMGERPEGKTLDKDKLGDGMLYSPETCCWLTPKEQARFMHKR